ncbi:MAG: shikimate kinase [Paracoccaceae bacterium]|jgi:shikimate kinase
MVGEITPPCRERILAMGETMPIQSLDLQKTIVFVGMMGSGKTAIGKALAVKLQVPFRDSDAVIEDASCLSIAEIFDRYGEPFFRDKESKVIARLLEHAPCILSTGGGAWLSPENRAAIDKVAVSVWLKADVDLLWSRVRHKTTRPLLRTANPRATLAEISAARSPAYETAQVQIETQPNWSIEDTTNAVLHALIATQIVKVT